MADLLFSGFLVVVGAVLIFAGYKARESEPFVINKPMIAIGIIAILAVPVLFILTPDPVAPDVPVNPDLNTGNTPDSVIAVPDKNPRDSTTEIVFGADILTKPSKCGELYCFNVNITSVALGKTESFDNVLVKTDEYFEPENYDYSFAGTKKEGYILVPSAHITKLLPPEEGEFA